jgi:hypothetical protein
MHRLLAILLTAGGFGPASAEPNAAPPNDSSLEKDAGPDAETAKTILEGRQKAVDDIRAGRPAPYYLIPPTTRGATTPPPPAHSGGDKKK